MEIVTALTGGCAMPVTYHVMNPYDDGIGLDEYVDWLVEAGYPIDRVAGYQQWL